MLWGKFSSHLSNPNILDYLIMKPLETEQRPLNTQLLKPSKCKNTVNAWTLYTIDVRLRHQLLMSIQDTTNCPAQHLQQVFASREGTFFKPLQWGKYTLVTSQLVLIADHNMWLNTSQNEEETAKQYYKIFRTLGSWLGPSLDSALISIAPTLPSSAQPAGLWPCLLTAQMWPQRARVLLLVQTIWGGSEGSTGSKRTWGVMLDEYRMLCGRSECFTATCSSHLDVVYEALPPPLGEKTLRISTTSFKPIPPSKSHYKQCLHILYSEWS